MRRIGVTTVLLAVVCSLGLTGAAATAASTSTGGSDSGPDGGAASASVSVAADSAVAGLTDSAALSTAPVMSGNVLTPDGAPAAAADVTLYAWPSNDVLERQKVGDTVNLQPVAYTTTSSTGSFALRLTSAAQLAPYAGADDIANLTAVATTDTGQVTEADFSRELVSTATGNALATGATAGAATTGSAQTMLADPAADTPDPAAAPAESVKMRLDAGSASASEGVAATGTAQAPMAKTCITKVMQTYSPVWVLVGQNYSTNPYAKANFQYYSDAHSTLGVGFSLTGKYGSFTGSGTVTKTSSTGVDFPTTVGANSRYHRTKWQFAKYQLNCVSPKAGQMVTYSVRAYKYVSGTSEVAVAAIAAPHCTSFAAGSHFTADRTKAVVWTNGADMSAGIGIDLSAQTGYGSHARIQWDFPRAAYLCGTADYPGTGTFRQLRAGR